MSLLRDMSDPVWDYFGDPNVGLPSEDIPTSGSLSSGLAAAAQGHLIRVSIANLESYPGKAVGEDGSHNFDPIPEDLEATAFIDGVERPLPAEDPLLLNTPAGKQYRMIFDASSTGLVPAAPDGAVLEIDLVTAPDAWPITPGEDGGVSIVPPEE